MSIKFKDYIIVAILWLIVAIVFVLLSGCNKTATEPQYNCGPKCSVAPPVDTARASHFRKVTARAILPVTPKSGCAPGTDSVSAVLDYLSDAVDGVGFVQFYLDTRGYVMYQNSAAECRAFMKMSEYEGQDLYVEILAVPPGTTLDLYMSALQVDANGEVHALIDCSQKSFRYTSNEPDTVDFSFQVIKTFQ
ncbi:MAG: hypothetical protein C5B59_08105 [Bacteroidetes bacterium]|nr:MAG: hypothetical protein C5B59_08105 [Bacteroidota bacterium]